MQRFIGILTLFAATSGCSIIANRRSSLPIQPESVIAVDGPFGDSNPVGNGELIVFALDTHPNKDSLIYRKVLKHLGYRYRMFRETDDHKMPVKGPMFKQAIWYHRALRYMSELATLKDDQIVILADTRDVIFYAKPEEVVADFKKLGKRILISATFQCCTTNYLPYIQDHITEGGSDYKFIDLPFPSLDEQKTIHSFWTTFFQKKAPLLEGEDQEFKYFWTAGQKTIIKGLSDSSKNPLLTTTNNRYVNAGTIIGYKQDLLKILTEINPKPWFDDEESWNIWFAKLANYNTYALDHFENIFGIVTSTSRPNGDELEILKLANDFPESSFPYRKFFRYTYAQDHLLSHWKTKTKIFHCPGCDEKENATMRKIVVDHLVEEAAKDGPGLRAALSDEEWQHIHN